LLAFVISRQSERLQRTVTAVKDDTIYYSRCNFSRSAIHCFDLVYPAREKRAWDSIVTRISLSLRPLQR
jgi:hypothetical protein